MIANASKVFPSPTLSAMMHPPNRSSFSMASTTPSRWNLKSFSRQSYF